ATPPEPVLTDTQVMQLWLSPQDPTRGLAGTISGVVPLHREAGGWKTLAPLPGIDVEIRGFQLDHDGAIWVSTLNRGLFRLLGVPGTALADGGPIRVEAYPGSHGFQTAKFLTIPRMATYGDQVRFLDAGDLYRFDSAQRRFVKEFNVSERFGVPGATV